jgi:hypothetical protein
VRRPDIGCRFRGIEMRHKRRQPNVVAYCDRFDCFDTAFHGDGSGARQIVQSLVLDRIFNRTIGPARAPFSWRRKSANQVIVQFKLDPLRLETVSRR